MPWIRGSFHLRYRSSRWNPLGWTRRFSLWPWKGCSCTPRLPCLCKASWTASTELSVPYLSPRRLLPDIFWVGLWLRQGGCSRCGQASMLSSSWRTSPLVLDLLQLQNALCLNLGAGRVALVLQVGDTLPVEIEHIDQRDGDLLLGSLIALEQSNCWRHDGLV